MDPKKILWPTDLSDNASKALPYVQSLGRQYQLQVHLLYVIEELARHESWYGDFDASHIEEIQSWEKKKAQERLEKICKTYLQDCPLYIKHVAVGDPSEEILKLVDEEKLDMVVMATKGRKGRFAFGSVAEKVVKNVPVPVITIPV